MANIAATSRADLDGSPRFGMFLEVPVKLRSLPSGYSHEFADIGSLIGGLGAPIASTACTTPSGCRGRDRVVQGLRLHAVLRTGPSDCPSVRRSICRSGRRTAS